MSDRTVTVRGKQVKLTNGDKVLYPEAGVTKGDVIAYYERVSDVLLPHLKGRALTMKRYPNGVDEQFFFQKTRPSTGRTGCAPSRSGRAATAATSTSDDQQPAGADLDRQPREPRAAHHAVAGEDQQAADDDGVRPRSRPAGDCRRVLPGRADAPRAGRRPRARAVPEDLRVEGAAGLRAAEHAARASSTPSRSPWPSRSSSSSSIPTSSSRTWRELREGPVLVDWSQNDDMKTTICVYSLRARPRPTVSTPGHLGGGRGDRRRPRPLDRWSSSGREVLERIESHGDLFEPVLEAPPAAARPAGLTLDVWHRRASGSAVIYGG